MIFDKLDNLSRYVTGGQFQKIAGFLREVSPDMEEKRYEIDGQSVYAKVMSYRTSLPDECRIEAHDQYIDIQASIAGAEGIDIFDRNALKVVQEYDAKSDAAFYEDTIPPCVSVNNKEGYFTMIFPEEAHRPQMSVDGQCEKVKKFVIKVRREKWTGDV